MQRRVALSVSFGFTIVVLFALVVLGRSSGLFGSASAGEADTAAATPADDVGAALRYLAAIGPPPASPLVVTEYVYVDEPADPPVVTYITREASPAPANRAGAAVPAPAVESAPGATTPAEEVPTTIAPQPPSPASPIPVAATTAPSGGVRDEDEFTGTATAVDGDIVTFTHGGTSTDVRVPASIGHVSVGDTVQVHAILLSTGWVAKEIESGD